ncbi:MULTISPECIES: tetratricopeptide repeat protein [Polyangium]|uniref:Tetratricopeptide repeat protein n=2 Tax=Polyangium TaxID=55 RepID=A0A4U1JA75_9BACT|nr:MULTISPECIES: hypothetical protein [Polyangium]MDI1430531.1 hypothetical protein [Polyangium sorediatum]TKD04336.1 hypothetical protein E8A74_23515 [Polyangium fumosum]
MLLSLLRAPAAALVLGALATAPFQCARDPDPEKAFEEPPEAALYQLAEQFRERGDKEARITTLRFLATRYPSTRLAERARQELAELGSPVPAPSP